RSLSAASDHSTLAGANGTSRGASVFSRMSVYRPVCDSRSGITDGKTSASCGTVGGSEQAPNAINAGTARRTSRDRRALAVAARVVAAVVDHGVAVVIDRVQALVTGLGAVRVGHRR